MCAEDGQKIKRVRIVGFLLLLLLLLLPLLVLFGWVLTGNEARATCYCKVMTVSKREES